MGTKFSLFGGNEIPKGADLHTYLTTGNYYYPQTATIGTLSNCPMNEAFRLKVTAPIANKNGSYILQEYTSFTGKSAAGVAYDPYNNVWGKPTEFVTKDDWTTISEAITQPSLKEVTFNDWIVLAERCGNMVTLSFNISGTMKAVSDFILLRTLNVKYRPLKQHFQAYTTQTGKPMTLKIDPNGQISLFNNNIEVSGFFLRQTISYPAE